LGGVAALVAGFYLLVGWMLILNNSVRVPTRVSAPLQILILASPRVTHPVRLLSEPPKIMVTLIRIPMPVGVVDDEPPPQPNVMAITVPSADQARPIHPAAEMIAESVEWDSGPLSQKCALSFPQIAQHLMAARPLILLVLVEEDGRPSQTRIIQSSGDELRDKTVDACVLSRGEYEPTVVDGRATASWQRIRWLHRN
jgi:hypothetical protein